MNIRPAKPADLPAICAIHITNWQDGYRGILSNVFLTDSIAPAMQAKWSEARLTRDIVLVAEQAGEVLGFVALERGRDDIYLDNLHVSAKAQGRAIGKILMRAGLAALEDDAPRKLWLKVLKGNRGALQFYERLGGEVSAPFEEVLMGQPVTSYKFTWADHNRLAEAIG